MDDLDKALRELGARWRATEPDPPELLASDLVGRSRARLDWQIALPALTLAVVVVAFVALSRHSPGADRDLSAWIVKPGDHVSAYGTIIVELTGVVRVCQKGASRLPYGTAPVCSPVAVVVEGLDPSQLPGRAEAGGIVYADGLRVRGTWTGTAISADRVERSSGVASGAVLTCTSPSGSWPSAGVAAADVEAAVARLDFEIATRPEVYGGTWSTPTQRLEAVEPTAVTAAVQVVGVVGDIAGVRDRLTTIFPYPLCVVPVEFSMNALAAVRDTLAVVHRGWTVAVVPELNRVRVRMTMLDQASVALLDAHPAVDVEPLVVPE